MKTVLLLFAGLSLACTQPEPPQPAAPPPPMKSQFCLSAEPPEALIKVQGARPDKDGCVETFPGELAIEITAPGYKTYQTLFLLEGHAKKQHIALEKETPASASLPAMNQPNKP
jgi:hypothetical protein